MKMFDNKNISTFGKAQLSAFIGGISDYLIMLLFVEVIHIHYTISIWISGLLGALVNFSLNKYWTYKAKDEKISTQLFKFYIVVLGSVALKSLGTYLFTEGVNVDYKISRLIIDLVVSLGYNYTLQRFWVFKQDNKQSNKQVQKKEDKPNTEKQKYYSKNLEYQEA